MLRILLSNRSYLSKCFERGNSMKQLMVLVATVILGISISGVVIGLGDNATTLADNVGEAVTAVDTAFDAAIAEGFGD